MCLYLHSKEQTGCLVCLQYRLAPFLQETHQPNFPAVWPISLTRLLWAYFEVGFSSVPSSPFFFFPTGTEYRGTCPHSSSISSMSCVMTFWSPFAAAIFYWYNCLMSCYLLS